MDPLLRRLFLNLLPAAMVIGIVYLAVFGESGLLRRHHMIGDLDAVQRRLANVQAQNATLRREISQLGADDETVKRAAAEELVLVPPGSTVYRFTP